MTITFYDLFHFLDCSQKKFLFLLFLLSFLFISIPSPLVEKKSSYSDSAPTSSSLALSLIFRSVDSEVWHTEDKGVNHTLVLHD